MKRKINKKTKQKAGEGVRYIQNEIEEAKLHYEKEEVFQYNVQGRCRRGIWLEEVEKKIEGLNENKKRLTSVAYRVV